MADIATLGARVETMIEALAPLIRFIECFKR
jgi:hypothetical protein